MSVGRLSGEPVDTTLTVMTEAELASMRAQEGTTVARGNGRYWRATYPGFYQPVHPLARLRAAEIRRPAGLCWGYRAALIEDDAHLANASVPAYFLTDAPHFTEALLSRNRRGALRRCRRQVEFRRLRDPALLAEQGYRVFRSAVDRIGHCRPMPEIQYRKRVERRGGHGRRLFTAGLIDGVLKGYLDAYAVNGVLYLEELYVATDAMPTGIGTGLYVEAIATAARAGSIREICNGLHTPKDPGLCRFKESLGFRVVHVPARSVIPAPVRAYLRARRPATYYRLTGADSPGAGPR